MWLNCDDYVDLITAGSTWTANVIKGTDTAGLLTTRMSSLNGWTNSMDAAKAYDAKAWLELNYSKANNPDYSVALWKIFSPTNPSLPANDLYNKALDAADKDSVNDYLTYRQHLTIYSPTTEFYGSSQELNTVPDGGLTVMLLGCALGGLETLRRRFHA